MRGLRRRRVPAQGNGAGRRHDLLSRLLAPLVSVAILATLLLLAAAPARVPADAGSHTGGSGPAVAVGAGPSAAPGDRAAAIGDRPSTTPFTFTGPVQPNPAGLGAFYGKRVTWATCADDERFDCGTVVVPVDYERPRGARTSVALRRLPASGPAHRIGSLLINPGGPGGSGIEFVGEAPDFFGDAVRQRYDIVGFDPRGMGQSDPVRCLRDSDLDAMYAADPTPDTPGERAAARKAPAERNRACLTRGGPLAARMGSEFVARDLDVLRSAVGDERLNYYGVSYGTMIGALYAQFFPSRVGHVVLDSAVLPDAREEATPSQQDVDASARGWADEFDDVVDDFATDCGSSVECPLGKDRAAVSATLVTFLDRLDRHPLETGYASLPRLTEGWATTAIGWGLTRPETWPDLVDALDTAVSGDDGSDLAAFAMEMVDRNEDGTYAADATERGHLPVTCADWPPSPWDSAVPSRDVLENHPLWARVEAPTTAECDGWTGVRRRTLTVRPDVSTPVLVIGNDDDKTTPIEDTRALAGEISRSRLVTVSADGHGAYGSDNDCADEVVDDYLARAKAPEDGFHCGA
ncbi:alpha/beta hydrolase [Terrabacter sp. NPDC080008]|uniref:alpha/beta hydrolase n=1 Tax=Terrabacter sp. NPDC080008 TaxID=3155176 RepID=UPI00344F299E